MAPMWWKAVLGIPTVAAVLAGCASSHTGGGTPASTPPAKVGLLAVHVGLFGGPPRRDGRMAASNAPDPDTAVSVMDATGRTWRATTGRDGIASVSVPAGRYTVSAPCGAPRRVSVLASKRTYVQVACDIP
jgi:hypothetical protein